MSWECDCPICVLNVPAETSEEVVSEAIDRALARVVVLGIDGGRWRLWSAAHYARMTEADRTLLPALAKALGIAVEAQRRATDMLISNKSTPRDSVEAAVILEEALSAIEAALKEGE